MSISTAGILLADREAHAVADGKPVYDAIRAAVESREQQIAAAVRDLREAARPVTYDDMAAHTKINAYNAVLSVVEGR